MRHMNAGRLGIVLLVCVSAAFLAGLTVISAALPDPSDGPTPPGTRVAYYGLFAACPVALALIPVAMWAADRPAGGRPALAWRAVLAAGAVLAMLALGVGVRTWAHPPHNLRRCFTDARGNGHSGIRRPSCERGLVNRPLGVRRLDEGFLAALLILGVTGAAVWRMAAPPPPASPARAAPPAGP